MKRIYLYSPRSFQELLAIMAHEKETYDRRAKQRSRVQDAKSQVAKIRRGKG